MFGFRSCGSSARLQSCVSSFATCTFWSMTSARQTVFPTYLWVLKPVLTVAIALKSLSIGLCLGGPVIYGKEAALQQDLTISSTAVAPVSIIVRES